MIASAAFMQACPREFRSRAYGLAVTALYAAQGGALLLAGALSTPLGSRGAVAAIAGLTIPLLVTVSNRTPRTQGNPDDDR